MFNQKDSGLRPKALFKQKLDTIYSEIYLCKGRNRINVSLNCPQRKVLFELIGELEFILPLYKRNIPINAVHNI